MDAIDTISLVDEYNKLKEENGRLRKLLRWWHYSSTVDATIMGPIFRGVSGSRKEVWQATLDEFELEEKEKRESI
jgi:histone acetyltransferase (RNA polymerase elongator complex component)